jgi:RHS repeat-associated protein
LIADQQEEIAEIKWNVQGKVQEIKRTANSKKSDLLFKYDAMGNRVSKTEIYPKAIEDVQSITTYYVRDAQGNVMAVYSEQKYEDGKIDLSLTEQHLYGSSRLGMRQVNELLVEKDEIKEFDQTYSSRNLGEKVFELSNHLGNVLAVVSDKKKADGTADVKAVYDYYPFGMTMPNRTSYIPSEDYRYGFNNAEKINEYSGEGNTYDLGARIYNPRLGKMLSIDPREAEYPWQSTYAYFSNSPVWKLDYNGEGDEEDGSVEGPWKMFKAAQDYYSFQEELLGTPSEEQRFSENNEDALYNTAEQLQRDLEPVREVVNTAVTVENMFMPGFKALVESSTQEATVSEAVVDEVSTVVAGAVVGGVLAKGISWGVGKLIKVFAKPAVQQVAETGSKIVIQFGKTPNQISHAFRHTDELGLNRTLVQSTVINHFNTVSSQVVAGQPFNQIVQIGSHRIQYTAYKLSDGIFNIGRIHAIP